MSTYVNSEHAMKTGQGRHRHHRRPDLFIRLFTTVAAFTVAAVALSGAMVLLKQASVTLIELAPSVALAFLSGAAFVIMVLVIGDQRDTAGAPSKVEAPSGDLSVLRAAFDGE